MPASRFYKLALVTSSTTVERLDDATRKLTFQLTEIPEPDRKEAVAAWSAPSTRARRTAAVIDRTGSTSGHDWDRALLGPAGPVTAWPGTLAILRTRLPAHPELAETASTEYGPLAVFHRPQPPAPPWAAREEAKREEQARVEIRCSALLGLRRLTLTRPVTPVRRHQAHHPPPWPSRVAQR